MTMVETLTTIDQLKDFMDTLKDSYQGGRLSHEEYQVSRLAIRMGINQIRRNQV